MRFQKFTELQLQIWWRHWYQEYPPEQPALLIQKEREGGGAHPVFVAAWKHETGTSNWGPTDIL